MNCKHLLSIAVIAALSFAAQAGVVGGLDGDEKRADFLDLGKADVSGGMIRDAMHDDAVAVTPKGAVGSYLAGEPGNAATLSFAAGTREVSFLWGSPDSFETLTVNDSDGSSASFTIAGLGLHGDGYVHFSATAAANIASLTFSASAPAFEAANFSVSPVPEPASGALFLAGLGLLAVRVSRRASRALDR